jgi:hypothetical protein
MSEIGAITPTNTEIPVDGHRPPEGDGKRRPPRRPRKPKSDEDMGEMEPHKLDVEA